MPKANEENRLKYRQLLRSFREKNSQDAIGNRYPWHCQIAVEELLEYAVSAARKSEVEIKLLTSSCTDFVYGTDEIMNKFATFLSKGGCMRVLVWSDKVDDTGRKLLKLKDDYPGTFQFRLSGTRELGNELQHFLVVGETAYRLEAPHEAIEGCQFNDFHPEIPARICFNDKKGGDQLLAFFDDLWQASDSAK